MIVSLRSVCIEVLISCWRCTAHNMHACTISDWLQSLPLYLCFLYSLSAAQRINAVWKLPATAVATH